MAEFLDKNAFSVLKTEIIQARADAENHAQALTSFTDGESNSFDKGAKGWSVDAETAKTAAEAAQSAAETAKTGAETAQTAAETALDSFDDRYLGEKSSDPTLDNDGNALLTGALYWNSTDNVLKSYDGSSWRVQSKITGLYHDITDLTATSDGQTTFNETYDVGSIQVLVNGHLLPQTDYTATNGTSVVLDSGVQTGDIVTVVHLATIGNTTTGTTVNFRNIDSWNTPTTPATGNITFDFTLARHNIVQRMFHNDATVPTIPGEGTKLNGSQDYATGSLNIIYFEWVDDDGSDKVYYWINQEA